MRHPKRDTRRDGKIAAVYGPLGNIYFRNHHPWPREYIGALVKELFPMPYRYEFTDFIPPLGPLAVEMDCPARPKAVRFIPEGEGGREGASTSLKWTWKDGRLRVTVLRLEIHGVMVVDLASRGAGPSVEAG